MEHPLSRWRQLVSSVPPAVRTLARSLVLWGCLTVPALANGGVGLANDGMASSPAGQRAPDGDIFLCRPQFVFRKAGPADHACVTPASQRRVAKENALAEKRRDPHGAHGPDSCRVGFVWREAFASDRVCVTPARRAAVRRENRLAPQRTVNY